MDWISCLQYEWTNRKAEFALQCTFLHYGYLSNSVTTLSFNLPYGVQNYGPMKTQAFLGQEINEEGNLPPRNLLAQKRDRATLSSWLCISEQVHRTQPRGWVRNKLINGCLIGTTVNSAKYNCHLFHWHDIVVSLPKRHSWSPFLPLIHLCSSWESGIYIRKRHISRAVNEQVFAGGEKISLFAAISSVSTFSQPALKASINIIWFLSYSMSGALLTGWLFPQWFWTKEKYLPGFL